MLCRILWSDSCTQSPSADQCRKCHTNKKRKPQTIVFSLQNNLFLILIRRKLVCPSCKDIGSIFTKKDNQHSAFTFISIYLMLNLLLCYNFCFFSFLRDIFFFWVTSSSGFGMICSFPVRSCQRGRESSWMHSSARLGSFVHLDVCAQWPENLRLNPHVQHYTLEF